MAQEESSKPLRKILRRPAVESVTGLNRSTLYELIAKGEFPKPIPLSEGGRAVGWLEHEIAEFQAVRIAARDTREAANG